MSEREMKDAVYAVKNELDFAKTLLTEANAAYDRTERAVRDAQRRSTANYETRVHRAREVDRLTKALALLEGKSHD